MSERDAQSGRRRTLIVVESPLQLLCAYEWILETRAPYVLIVRLIGAAGSDAQLKAMARELDVVVSRWIFLPPRVNLRYALAVISFLPALFRPYERLVIGNYFSGFLRIVAKLTRCRNVILLDDGVATLLAGRELAAEKSPRFSVFTIFTLEPGHYRSYVRNSFRHLMRSTGAESAEPNGVYFVGQKLVDIGALPLERYLDVVRLCVRDNPGAAVHYIPHRGESEEVIAAIGQEPGVELLKIDWNIEYYMVRNRITPARIYSVNSTALYSLATMFPSCNATAFDPAGLRTEMFAHYQLIHDAFCTLPNLVIRRA
ncbi:MAG TPA: hypothetical protein VEK57_02640 [Thermoanaerobaculia bacterium]|nr:hypothetical protein [Thermoanaerobaculia bacterium]